MAKEEKPVFDFGSTDSRYLAGALSLAIAAQHGVERVAFNELSKCDGSVLGNKLRKTAPALSAETTSKAGFVYVIFLDELGERFFKIGMSSFFSAHFDEHKCSSPFEVRVACAYFTSDMRAEERALHEKYKLQNVRGEWFRLSDADLAEIAARSLLL